jgi:hypothetical protein
MDRVIELEDRRFGFDATEDKFDVHPYVIFFKNFTMVYRPFVRLPSLHTSPAHAQPTHNAHVQARYAHMM